MRLSGRSDSRDGINETSALLGIIVDLDGGLPMIASGTAR
jgi:hypothetical protein